MIYVTALILLSTVLAILVATPLTVLLIRWLDRRETERLDT